MNITIPFSKEIVFKSKIAEICSISLEHDISINEKELLGDFIITGDYKNLDINVDVLPFSHIVPFSVNLDEDINIETLSYDISDFSYEIIGDDILKVNISLHVEAEKKENQRLDIFEEVNDNVFNGSFLKEEENNIIDEENKVLEEEKEEKEIREEETTKEKSDEEARNDVEKSSLILSDDLKEDYITYHVHLVKADETLDKISSEYKISKEELKLINDVTEINIGDKLIIPLNNDKEE